MGEQQTIVDIRHTILAGAIGTEAVLALLPPWCGLGWGPWTLYLGCATVALVILMLFVWSR